jgi:hypothetical protein
MKDRLRLVYGMLMPSCGGMIEPTEFSDARFGNCLSRISNRYRPECNTVIRSDECSSRAVDRYLGQQIVECDTGQYCEIGADYRNP